MTQPIYFSTSLMSSCCLCHGDWPNQSANRTRHGKARGPAGEGLRSPPSPGSSPPQSGYLGQCLAVGSHPRDDRFWAANLARPTAALGRLSPFAAFECSAGPVSAESRWRSTCSTTAERQVGSTPDCRPEDPHWLLWATADIRPPNSNGCSQSAAVNRGGKLIVSNGSRLCENALIG